MRPREHSQTLELAIKPGPKISQSAVAPAAEMKIYCELCGKTTVKPRPSVFHFPIVAKLGLWVLGSYSLRYLLTDYCQLSASYYHLFCRSDITYTMLCELENVNLFLVPDVPAEWLYQRTVPRADCHTCSRQGTTRRRAV